MSKKREALIKIKGIQRAGGDDDVVELLTTGFFSRQKGGYLISYEESEATGFEGAKTTLLYEEEAERVTLTRSGSVNSQMVFEEGRQHTSLYETPFGELSIDIQTSRLRHNLTGGGGLMEIKYSIAVEHTVTGRNCFKIRVRRR